MPDKRPKQLLTEFYLLHLEPGSELGPNGAIDLYGNVDSVRMPAFIPRAADVPPMGDGNVFVDLGLDNITFGFTALPLTGEFQRLVMQPHIFEFRGTRWSGASYSETEVKVVVKGIVGLPTFDLTQSTPGQARMEVQLDPVLRWHWTEGGETYLDIDIELDKRMIRTVDGTLVDMRAASKRLLGLDA